MAAAAISATAGAAKAASLYFLSSSDLSSISESIAPKFAEKRNMKHPMLPKVPIWKSWGRSPTTTYCTISYRRSMNRQPSAQPTIFLYIAFLGLKNLTSEYTKPVNAPRHNKLLHINSTSYIKYGHLPFGYLYRI